MSLSEEDQHPGTAPAQTPEPRLLTRPDRTPSATPTPPPPRKPRRSRRHNRAKSRRPRLLARLALSLVLLLLATIAAAVLYLRHTLVASLPQLDGTLHLAGLTAPVTVTRDPRGVPVIQAATLNDLLFAQGYTTAADRLWQMDALRRHAAGELAEILGPSLVEHDRRQRYLQIRAAADRATAHLPADQLAQLDAYARGVNAFLDTHRDSLPLEFHLLAYTPARWSPRDSLLVSLAMWQDLATEFPRKLDREALSAHLPPNLVADLYPVGSWRDQPPANQSRDLTAPHIVEQIPLDPSQSRLQPTPSAAPATTLLALTQAFNGPRCEACQLGSNNWALSGAHTASGAPLLANDMHLSLAIPDIWYEASLRTTSSPALDVTGFTLPGVPFVIVGRNAHLAWGVTNLGADVQDLRIEHLRGQDATTEYQLPDGSWAPVTHHPETIRVRGGRNRTLDVLTTTHAAPSGSMETPILSPLYPGETRALSLAWTAYDPTAVNSPFFGVDTATDGSSLVVALASFGGPSLNLVWADSAGHIGYHALGLVPVRGPALQHPRSNQTSPVPTPTGPAPPDEGDEPTGPQALLATRPHLLLSAFKPQRPRHAEPRPSRPAARRQPHLTPKRQQRAAAKAAPEPEPLPPAPTPIAYTIGSPIASVPVDALDASQAWTAYIPYDALPAVVDPANGLLATANARITPDDFPYAVTSEWTDPFRVERIVHLLAGSRGLTPTAMLRIQTDVHSEVNLALAQRLAYALDHASPGALGHNAARLHQAANLLRDWDGAMQTDSSAAAVVVTVRSALWPALLVPQLLAHNHISPAQAADLALLYTWAERTSALEILLQHEPARWLPPSFANWNDFLAATTAAALRPAPSNLAHWRYGQIHTVDIAHPLLGAHPLLSRLLGIRSSTGPQPAPGDGTTIDAIGAHFGPSERFIADLASTSALGNITTGQSANPRSAWYLDQFSPWLLGQTFPLPTTQPDNAHTLTLLP